MENYQREDGLVVPEPLRKYMPGNIDFIPYVRELPKDSTSQQKKSKVAKKAGAVDETAKKMEAVKV